MKPNFFYGVIPLVLALAMPVSANDSNWPNYLGPDKNAVSPDLTPLADSWPAEGPPELWSHKLSPGHGGAAIYDGKSLPHGPLRRPEKISSKCST